MKHTFEYLKVISAMDSFDVEEVGSCCLKANNDGGEEFWLLVRTLLGNTKVLTFGPLLIGTNIFEDIKIEVQSFQYNEKRVIKTIDTWLNDPKKAITQLEESDLETCLDTLKEISIVESILE